MKAKILIIAALLFGLTADTFAQPTGPGGQKRYKYKKHYRKAPHHKVYRPAHPAPPRPVVVSLPAPPRPKLVRPPLPPAPPRPKLPPPPPRPPLPGGGK